MGFLFNALSAGMSSLEARMLSLETSVNQHIHMLTGKISELAPARASSKIAPTANNRLSAALPLQ